MTFRLFFLVVQMASVDLCPCSLIYRNGWRLTFLKRFRMLEKSNDVA
jgi:nitrogen fixation protein